MAWVLTRWAEMRISTVVMAAAVSFCATTALAAEQVGEVMAATDATSVSGQADERPLKFRSEVSVGDRLATGAGGVVELLFNKRIWVALAANTSLGIDDDAATKQTSLYLHEGSMRVVLGGGETDYTFRTDYAEVIPLGTVFDLTALPNDGGTELVLLKGQVELCGENGDCETVKTQCGLLQAKPGKDVEEITVKTDRVRETSANFPFLTAQQSSLHKELQFPGHGCVDGSVAGRVLPQSAIPTEAIIVGAFVVIGGVVIGLVTSSDSNNKTND